MLKRKKTRDLWIIAPPKPQDIKFDPKRNEYTLQYIHSEDDCKTCEVMTLKTRNYLALHRRIETLQFDAQIKRQKGQRVDNWLFGGDHV